MPFDVNDTTSARYYATLLDDTRTLVPSSGLTTLTLTLTDRATGTVLNNRNAQNVLNANGVTVYDTLQNGVDENGKAITYNLLWQMDPADNALVSSTRALEPHVAVWIGTFGSGKEVKHDVVINVRRVG